MKVSLNLIKQLTRVKLGNEELLNRIHSRLAEVEGVENLADKYKGIVVAEIKKASSHPDADKLGVYEVDNGKEVVQVVAGDKTLKVGDKVAHILPGLIVPSTYHDEKPVVLEKVNLRGKESNGMLGSAKELDFGEEHGGVLKLDTKAKAGTSLIEAYELDDVIIDVENKTLTHRPDCFGLIGFAREIAGIQDLKFKSPDWYLNSNPSVNLPKSKKQLPLNVVNKVGDDCPTYLAVVMSNVTIEESSVQMRSYLSRVGVRPINNVVDMTNYLMVLTGQPLHAFDYDKVSGHEIIIRYPIKGETLKLLDGKEVELDKRTVAICDKNGPVALGGVMGGADSEITTKTNNIIIECASFDMYSIRRTSMRYGIFSDAATRFMRGQSPQSPMRVIHKAVQLTNEVSGASVASDVVGYSQDFKAVSVSADPKKINNLLGIDMKPEEQTRRLENVEIKVSGSKITAPFWRRDLHIWQDIAEEVGRLTGFDNISATVPKRSIHAVDLSEIDILKNRVRTLMRAGGANEVLTYSGVSLKLMEKVNLSVEPLYRIRNSLSPELEYMRGTLLPSLMSKIHLNHRRGYGEFALFEIGKTHSKKDVGKDSLPVEHERLGLVFSADKKTAKVGYQGAPYYQAKRYLEYLLTSLGVKNLSYETEAEQQMSYVNGLFTVGRRSKLMVNDVALAVIGEFTHRARLGLKLPEFSAGFELDLNAAMASISEGASYGKLSKFPGSEQDVTFVTPNKVSLSELRDIFSLNLKTKAVRVSIDTTDAYQKSDDSPERNITFRVGIENLTRTMSAEELNKLVDDAVAKTNKALKTKRI